MADHPTHQELAALAFGQLSEDQAENVAAHIEQCPRCEETAEQFDTAPDDVILGLNLSTVYCPGRRIFVDQEILAFCAAGP